jgi:adenosylcobyric acid synthase
MMGKTISDLSQVETLIDTTQGLGLLPIQTQFDTHKATFQTKARLQSTAGWLANLEGQMVEGYEIHMGDSQTNTAWLHIFERNKDQVDLLDGNISPDGRLWGCYLHGIFSNTNLRRAWLMSLGWQSSVSTSIGTFNQALDYLGQAVESSLNMDLLEQIIWGS